jgi:hypothetical protein
MGRSAIQFSTPDAPWSSNALWEVVYPLKFVFGLLKGRDPLKKKFKIGGNVEEYKAYLLIPLTSPLPCH